MSLLSSLRARAERRRGFNEMMKLDDHLLRDIGISRGELATAAWRQSVRHPYP